VAEGVQLLAAFRKQFYERHSFVAKQTMHGVRSFVSRMAVIAKEHVRPRLVIYISNSLAPSSADPGIVEEDVNGSPVEFRDRRFDTRWLRDIQSENLQAMPPDVSQTM
jgi:hypothetical protein